MPFHTLEIWILKIGWKNLGKEKKFRKDFTPEQYAAYLERKAKNPDVLMYKNDDPQNKKTKSEKKPE